jgi:cellobiose transport system permease protein
MTQGRHRSLAVSLWKNRVAYAYIAPFYILFLVFGLFPIGAGLVVSFFRWNGLDPMRFIGVQNYARLLGDRLFWKALGNTAVIGLVAHVFILGGALVLAYVLNSRLVKCKDLFKTVYFLPMVTSAVASAIVFKAIFGTNNGLINCLLKAAGSSGVDWFGGVGAFVKVPIIAMFAWQWIGWNMVIYLAGMQAISVDLYEAATIDGAGGAQVFLRITVPLLKPIILFTIIQSTIGTLNLYTEPYVLTNSLTGGAANQGLTAMMYLLLKAPQGNNLYGYASACAYIITAIIIGVSALNIKAFNREKPGEGEAA